MNVDPERQGTDRPERAPQRDPTDTGMADSNDRRQLIHDFLHAIEPGEDSPQTGDNPASPPPPILGEGVGTTIGPYKLLQRLGEGAFGTVFMAEQRTPIKRCVALKVIKQGMDTKRVIARFDAERQALAMMDHPNIAKVLDAGATETGRPFFVMELVKGTPITVFCNDQKFDLRERLDLFKTVCAAVQHAHHKGIIHRDLKPSNILVSLDGDTATPKIIDFGVAKAIHQKLTDKTLFTHIADFIGTPLYMSPEQAKLTDLDIDTRSDIYSLGVLLYELLTGKTPFDSQALLSAGIDEMRRVILEQDAPKPSTKLGTLDGPELETIAKARRTEPRKLGVFIKGDLDWIILKALEKERTRRYQTANGLAADIERFLANETVSATPPSGIYRFWKFARRNKTVLASAVVISLLLLAGTTTSTYLWIRESKAEELAKARQKEAEEQRNAADLARANAVRAQTQAELARASADELIRFMQYELRDNLRPLGHPEILEGIFSRIREYYEKVPVADGQDASQLAQLREYEVTLGALATTFLQQRRFEEARHAWLDTVAIGKRLVAAEPGNRKWQSDLAWAHAGMGNALQELGDLHGAEQELLSSIKILKRLAEIPDPKYPPTRDIDFTYGLLAEVARAQGDEKKALETLKDARKLLAGISVFRPENTGLAIEVAALQAWFGQEEDYAATCRRMVNWARTSQEAGNAERIAVAKLASLHPISDGGITSDALMLVRKDGIIANNDLDPHPWHQAVLGMAEYRKGHFVRADEALLGAIQALNGSADASGRYHINCISRIYRAMIHVQNGKATEAASGLDAVTAEMKPFPANAQYPLAGRATHDDLIVWLAWKEAKAMLESEARNTTDD